MSAAAQLDLFPGPQLALVFNRAAEAPAGDERDELDPADEAEAAEEAAGDYADAQIAAALPHFALPLSEGRTLVFRPEFGDCFLASPSGYGQRVALPLLVSLDVRCAMLRVVDPHKPGRDVRAPISHDDAELIISGWAQGVTVTTTHKAQKLPRQAGLAAFAYASGLASARGERPHPTAAKVRYWLWLYAALADLAHELGAGRLSRAGYLKACELVRERVGWI